MKEQRHMANCPICGSDDMVHIATPCDPLPPSICRVCVPNVDERLQKMGHVTFRLGRKFTEAERAAAAVPVYVPEPCTKGRATLMDMLHDELGYYPATREPVRTVRTKEGE